LHYLFAEAKERGVTLDCLIFEDERIEEALWNYFEATRKGALHEFCCFVCFDCVIQVGVYFLALTPSHQDEDEFTTTTMEEMHVGGCQCL
jgi:hypothetical protein